MKAMRRERHTPERLIMDLGDEIGQAGRRAGPGRAEKDPSSRDAGGRGEDGAAASRAAGPDDASLEPSAHTPPCPSRRSS